ncbi:hypothetical protein HYPSUDRAFT_216187 [Hypholoma sublateritium FD-334 SS-4]|uniref:Uncharacterized protein n=1 Tax=Hypholoma sublateritium (strain FD-334 SS-4) TaxID=945553 RepID=A0A0D2NS53_HYPSF|nr:hypothetical protein HYPSUDRAFT_216187 [Hypholoma sublateritium FD-334 SS-4]
MGGLYTVGITAPLNAHLPKMQTAYRLTLLYIIVATLATAGTNGVAEAKPKVNVGRFALRGESGLDSGLASRSLSGDLTEAEAHALWLTSRKPTRRSTAQRRQASAAAVVEGSRFAATDASTGTSYGDLVYGTDGWTLSTSDTPSTLVYSRSSGFYARDSREAQRLTYTSQNASDPYRIFGVGQCYAGSPTTIGSGSSNVLCLVNAISGTRAGSRPDKVKNNLDPSGSSYVETNIWTVDYSKKTASPTWINSDGTAIPAYIVVAVKHPDIIFVTGDVAATSAHYGLEFRPVTLSYTNSS